MRAVVITPPEAFVSLEDAKLHLRVTDDDSDAMITAYIAAACAHIDGPEGWLGRAIGQQTIEARSCYFSEDSWRLPYPPVISVTSVKYLDTNGVEQTLTTDQYEVRGDRIVQAYDVTWPSVRSDSESVRVRYQAGYATIPPAITAAVLLMVGDLFNFRETAIEGNANAVPMSPTVEALLSPFRVYS